MNLLENLLQILGIRFKYHISYPLYWWSVTLNHVLWNTFTDKHMTQNLSHVSYDSLFISVANCANAGELPFSALQKLVYWLAKYLSACKLSFTYQKFQELTLFAQQIITRQAAEFHSTKNKICTLLLALLLHNTVMIKNDFLK